MLADTSPLTQVTVTVSVVTTYYPYFIMLADTSPLTQVTVTVSVVIMHCLNVTIMTVAPPLTHMIVCHFVILLFIIMDRCRAPHLEMSRKALCNGIYSGVLCFRANQCTFVVYVTDWMTGTLHSAFGISS